MPQKALIEYWNRLMASAGPRAQRDALERRQPWETPVLHRISSPTLVITTDRGTLQRVESVLEYHRNISDSRVLVLQSDSYHVAMAKPTERVANVLAFIGEIACQRKER